MSNITTNQVLSNYRYIIRYIYKLNHMRKQLPISSNENINQIHNKINILNVLKQSVSLFTLYNILLI